MRKLTLALSAAAIMVAGCTAAYAHNHGKMPMGDMTRAQAQEYAESRFAKMDANSDGVLNDADREARMAARFAAMDANSDGSISKDEFMAAHADRKGYGRKGDGERGEGRKGYRMGRHGHGGAMMMKMADANADGQVTKDEFVGAALAHFDKADANKDGTVTAEERKAAMQAMHAEWRGKNKGGSAE